MIPKPSPGKTPPLLKTTYCRLMVKILITTIQVNLVPLGQLAQNSPELLLLKFLPLTYHHSHFLAATLDFTSLFTIAFSWAALLFLQLGCC